MALASFNKKNKKGSKKSASATNKKKAGGKKTRLAAQRRDRYWGESVDDDKESTHQQQQQRPRRPGEGRRDYSHQQKSTGKARLPAVASSTAAAAAAAEPDNDGGFSDDTSYSSSSNEQDEENGAATAFTTTPVYYTKLMQSLTTNRRAINSNNSNELDDVDDEELDETSSLTSANEEKATSDADAVAATGEPLSLLPVVVVADNVFATHFARPPFRDDAEIAPLRKRLQTATVAVTVEEASLELRASQQLFAAENGPLSSLWLATTPTAAAGCNTAVVVPRQVVLRRAAQYWQQPTPPTGSNASNTETRDDMDKEDDNDEYTDYARNIGTLHCPILSQQQKTLHHHLVAALLLPAVRSYADVLVTTDCAAGTTTSGKPTQRRSNTSHNKNRHAIHTVLAWHIVQHVWMSRKIIDRHNRRLRRREENNRAAADDDDAVANRTVEWSRDQGFTRPTVLVLLPTRHCCYTFVKRLLSLLLHDNANDKDVDDDGVINMERFAAEYGPPSVSPDEQNGNPRKDDKIDRQRRLEVLRQKGSEWNDLFGDDRNDDDDFKLGLQLNWKRSGGGGSTRDNKAVATAMATMSTSSRQGKCSIKLYSDFYRSDIIIASPLGLKMAMQGSGTADEGDEPERAGSDDFLSSIEICLVARADVLWQQNWDHLDDVLSRLNQRPQAMNQTDFSRVRQYLLAGQAANWRQLIVCSNMTDPMIGSCFKRHAVSIQGQIKLKRQSVAVTDASIASVWWPDARQVFQRVATSSFANAGDDRLRYFLDHVWPKIESRQQRHTMIFVPSYFEFCSLRNALLQKLKYTNHSSSSSSSSKPMNFVCVTEYTPPTEVARGRARFLQGQMSVLLYTGRAHFFLRHAIKGVRHLIFFGVPEVASFYADHVNRINEGLDGKIDNDMEGDMAENASCLALFTKYDSHSLERIVGSINCNRMIQGEKSTFLFSSS